MDAIPELGAPDLATDLSASASVLRLVETHLASDVCQRRDSSVSSWGVGQQLVHVCLVAGSIGAALERLVRRGGEPAESRPATRALLATGTFPRGAAEAPEPMTRARTPGVSEIRDVWAKAHRRWESLAGRHDAIREAEGTIPHFELGPLSAAEWVRFAAAHGIHHLRIVDEILGARLP